MMPDFIFGRTGTLTTADLQSGNHSQHPNTTAESYTADNFPENVIIQLSFPASLLATTRGSHATHFTVN